MAIQIPNIANAKIIRIDKKRNNILIWFGGDTIEIHSLQAKRKPQLIDIRIPVEIECGNTTIKYKGLFSYSTVKNKMKEIINRKD